MTSTPAPVKSPLTIIAILAGTVEATALAALPLLDVANQSVFLWFLIGFPPFLTLLFFITLNFNHTTLYSPDDLRGGGKGPGPAQTVTLPTQRGQRGPAAETPTHLFPLVANGPRRGLSRFLELSCSDVGNIPAVIEELAQRSGLSVEELITPAPLLLLVYFDWPEKG